MTGAGRKHASADSAVSEFHLSICIPTYERAALLARACGKIVEQVVAEGLEDRVELCVSDNASTDGTKHEVATLARSGVAVAYRRQQRNLGFARNLDSAVRMAQGRYVMLAGDDDVLLPNALRAAYEVSLRERDIIIFNSFSGAGRGAQEFRELDLDDLPLISGPVQANDELGVFHLSFIGNLMFRRETYERHYRESFAQSAYPHTCVLLSALRESPAVFVNVATFEVDDAHRCASQPLLTAIDMSKVQTECALAGESSTAAARTYRGLVRSIPRAVLQEKLGHKGSPSNPYADLSLRNLLDCYRRSRPYQLTAAALWLAAKLLPPQTLKLILR